MRAHSGAPLRLRVVLLLRQGVGPAEPSEASEITISGADLATVLDGERREVRVRRDIACRPQRFHEAAEDGKVTFRRMQDESARLGQPAIDYVEGVCRLERVGEELGARRKPHEREED